MVHAFARYPELGADRGCPSTGADKERLPRATAVPAVNFERGSYALGQESLAASSEAKRASSVVGPEPRGGRPESQYASRLGDESSTRWDSV